ncbi:fucolectin-4-like [Pseudorasbora parva]|uniref:fucolectin-4-like n=1 Tax=Pseudorasbora parva TaxID=51549 RepID=UPI00351E0DD7
MISRMAVRVILFLTLFTGLCVADSTVKDTTSCPCSSGPRNLALGAPAVQSSTHPVLKADARNAVDGNRNSVLDSGSCSHTDEDMSPWWRVDLLDVYTVTRVSITNRGDAFAKRINGAQIRIGNSLENNGNNNELAAIVVSIAHGETKTFDILPIHGRYVNIFIPGRSEYLTLCEVEVFGDKYTSAYTCAPRNLALGATAVQSSTHPVLKAAAKSAVDGNRNSILDSRSCSHTDEDMSPWWRVELPEVSEVTRVSITNRGDAFAKRINGAQIRIGNSLENNGNSNELAATVESIPHGETKTFKFRPIKGRYVNIVIPGRSEFLTLCEVEVFAD